jgi:hypothetical protein
MPRQVDKNRVALDYFRLPRLGFEAGSVRVCEEKGLELDSFRYDSLDPFVYLPRGRQLGGPHDLCAYHRGVRSATESDREDQRLEPPGRNCRVFNELVASIKQLGLKNPIVSQSDRTARAAT